MEVKKIRCRICKLHIANLETTKKHIAGALCQKCNVILYGNDFDYFGVVY